MNVMRWAISRKHLVFTIAALALAISTVILKGVRSPIDPAQAAKPADRGEPPVERDRCDTATEPPATATASRPHGLRHGHGHSYRTASPEPTPPTRGPCVFHENENGGVVHVVETPGDRVAVVVHERGGANIHLNEGTGGRGAEVAHVNERGFVIHMTEPSHETAPATATASPGPDPMVSATATAAATAE